MKTFTKLSVAAAAIVVMSSGAYAVTVVNLGTGGLNLTTDVANSASINVSNVVPVANTANTVRIIAPQGTNIYEYDDGTNGTNLLMSINTDANGGSVLNTDLTTSGTIYGDLSTNNSLNLNDTTDGWWNSSLSAEDDIILNADSPDGGYGGVIMQKAGTTLMTVGAGYDSDVNIYANTYMYDDLDMTGNQIHGLAPGTVGTDAVNLNQLNEVEKDLSKGIAATTAIANIPQVEAGKKASIGLGYGHYNGENAIAAGASWHFGATDNGVMKVSVGTGGSGETAVGAGASWSW